MTMLADQRGGSPRLQVVRGEATVDRAGAEAAVFDLLVALGQDPTSPHLADTPARVAAAFEEMLTARPFHLTTFPNDEGYEGLIMARDLPFRSLCEHHLLPFQGVAHIGYLPGARLVGLSKLARVVEHFAARLQVQERLTVQVGEWLDCHLSPRGVGVVIDAEHQCMTARGAMAAGSRTITSSLHGLIRDDGPSRAEFLALTR